ncbi:MAG: ribosomal-processing cysteine protease Prp [Bacillota bacterium]
MTTATFKQHGDVFRIQIEGHADYNPGQDIICASCSTLAYTLLQCLKAEQESNNFIVFDHDIKEGVGSYYVKMRPLQRAIGYIEVMVNTIASGFALLAHKYPNHVKFIYHNS